MIKPACIFLLTLLSTIAFATSHEEIQKEANTANYLKSIKSNQQSLKDFLWAMPKGADLHVHVTGATYAENMLHFAYADDLCINRNTYTVYADPSCDQQSRLNIAVQQPEFKEKLIDAWSMRNFNANNHETSHDHFFEAIVKFYYIPPNHPGEVLSEIAERAASQNELHLELMVNKGSSEARVLGKSVAFNPDFDAMRKQLLSSKLDHIMKNISQSLDKDEATMHKLLACDTSAPSVGCKINIRYLLRAEREQAPEIVFTQLLLGFETAKHDSRIVGVNLVQAEDGTVSMRDYQLQMQMIGFLHKLYPDVPVSLHAGELTEELVPKEGLTFHIHDAVHVAKASRIGHGVDIAHEDKAEELLADMAKNHVMVEINLTSNEQILGIKGLDHPLPLYLDHQVPVSLSTDDEGVSRINLTQEYQRAVLSYDLDYSTLKKISRNSIAYSFLPGQALWQDDDYNTPVADCSNDALGNPEPSSPCKGFLDKNEKAKFQWELEERFNAFESKFG